jgi:hypothetical protein
MGNAPASIGPAFNARTIARALLNGNGTISLTGLPYVGDAILVAIPEHAILLPVNSAVFLDIVETWVNRVANAITSRPAPFHNPRYFGVWTDPANGEVHYDIVEAFPREELDAAIDAGITRNQIAIWDNGRGELYATNGSGAVD